MAKARISAAGNVKLTMTQEQYAVLIGILYTVRLGDRNQETTDISDLLIDIGPLAEKLTIEDKCFDISQRVSAYMSLSEGVGIEIND